MSDPKNMRAEEIFAEALEMTSSDRFAWIDEVCGDDSDLRAEVQSLLDHVPGGEKLLEGSILKKEMGNLAAESLDETLEIAGAYDTGDLIGPYRLLRKIGEGGMGEVWLAEQTKPIQRQVAVKIIKAGMDTREVVARFHAERQALALMEHPSIAQVFDAGATGQGRPYFAMEYVKGVPITEYCDKHRLTNQERLKLFQQLCDGVQHAHLKAVIHRDLKPNNVLVTEVDGKPLPKIIDFGIAKATAQRLTEMTMFTEMGQIIGTPEYMSPEQADLSGEDVDTRTDVYSLGVILYELLVGVLPFDARMLRQAGYEGIRRIIREKDPRRPSTRIGTLSEKTEAIVKARRTGPKRLTTWLKGDLDWILMRTLDKDRGRRYGSPSELSSDIERHLKDEPVSAGPPTARYRMGKFYRRNRAGVLVGGAMLVVLIGFAGTMAFQARVIAEERDRANHEAQVANQVAAFLANMLGDADPQQMGTTLAEDMRERVTHAQIYAGASEEEFTAAMAAYDAAVEGINPTDAALRLIDDEVLSRAAVTIEEELADEPLIAANLHHTIGVTYQRLGLLESAGPQLQKAVDIRKRELGSEDLETLTSLHHLGQVLASSGKSLEVTDLYAEVLAARRRLLGDENPETLGTMYFVALLYQIQARYQDSEALYTEAMETGERIHGEGHPVTLANLQGLGILYSIQGRHEKSEPILREVLAKQIEYQGEDELRTMAAKMSLAIVLADLGKFAEAEKYYLEALAGRRRILGDSHHTTIVNMSNLGIMYATQGRFAEAEPMITEAVRNSELYLGKNSHATAFARTALTVLHGEKGNQAVADPLYRQLIMDSEEIFGYTFFGTLRAMEEATDYYLRTGREEEARATLDNLIAMSRNLATKPGADPGAKSAFAWLLLNCEPAPMRDPETALRFAREADQMTGHRDPDYLDTLALAYFANGQPDLALETSKRALDLLPQGSERLRKEFEERHAVYEAAQDGGNEAGSGDYELAWSYSLTKSNYVHSCHY
jgi:serine/threonine protein kinase/tetratricopeptide (TPR) repeat protein